MAHQIGNAADHVDLFAKLKAFLTGDATLSAAGQAWTVAWTAPVGAANPTDVVLRGPGLSGTDRVLVGVRLVADPTGLDVYWIELFGMSGVLVTATSLEQHVNVQPHTVRIFLDDGPMSYWLTASGRRFILTVKISTIFESCYAGYFLPYADPTVYPYPLFIGGSGGAYDASGGTGTPVTGWRSIADGHRIFTSPYYRDQNNTGQSYPTAYMLSPGADWLGISTNGNVTNVGMHPERGNTSLMQQFDVNKQTPNTQLQLLDASPDGSFPLIPVTLIQLTPTIQTFGILDGMYRVPGQNNSSENIITVDGVDHLVVQNVFRTGVGDYSAMALENLG